MKFKEFKLVKLSDYAQILPGFAFKSKDFTDNSSDIPLVKGDNLQQGYIDWSSSKYWPNEKAAEFEKYKLKPGDIVLAMDRPWVSAGLKWAYIKENDPESLLVQRVAKINAKKGLKQEYLRYIISSSYFTNYIQPIVTGVNVPHISAQQIGNCKIPLPYFPIQKKIAAVLSAYDDLIENNKRRINLLEKMAKEIYREWFVRFRFPGHEKVKFEKGVPSEWYQRPANEVFSILSGGTPKTDVERFWDGKIPFFTPKDAGDNIYFLNTEKCITEKGLEACNSKLYKKNTMFITARGTVGKIVLSYKNTAMNQSCYALELKNGGEIYFYYFAMKNAISYIKGISKSGVFDNIIVDTFKVIPLIIPRHNLIKYFNEQVGPLIKKIGILLEANILLNKTRDSLLPRLISGKLSVEDLDIKFPPSMEEEVHEA